MKWNQIPRHIVGLFVMVLASAIIAGLFFVELPEGNRDVALVILGICIGWGSAVVAYHFGTSEGSSRKTDLMASDRGDRSGPMDP